MGNICINFIQKCLKIQIFFNKKDMVASRFVYVVRNDRVERN